MKGKKVRRLFESRLHTRETEARDEAREAPGFLVRLVGKTQAKRLCREGDVQPRRD